MVYYSIRSYSTIIIGSGISGLNFALRQAEKGRKVLIITKKRIVESATNFAQGGIAAVISQLDDFKKHVKDTLVAGSFHNNKRAVEYMVRHGPAAISRLLELGVPFTTQNGKLLLTAEGGHRTRRIAFVSDYTGQAIEKVLVAKVRKNPFITLYEHTFAVDLLIKNRTCYGVQILRGKKFENIYGDITVLATGGIGQLYEYTTNPVISTGDGLAMAARAGCKFRDLEFIQFHPTALKLKGKQAFLISEALRGEGALLLNSKAERFMPRYHKLAELAPRDIVSRAIFEEEKNGPVFLDLRHKKETFLETRFPQIYQKLKSYGLNLAHDLIPISPAAHYICGGVKVNLKGETGIKNLYAFGEAAGTGVHGANRLASNSLLEALVFSDRILESHLPTKQNFSRQPEKKLPSFSLPKIRVIQKTPRYLKACRKNLQQIMWKYVGIVRSKKSLLEGLKKIRQLEKKVLDFRKVNREILEFKNMVMAAKLITQAALKRKKSLGCHCINHEFEQKNCSK